MALGALDTYDIANRMGNLLRDDIDYSMFGDLVETHPTVTYLAELGELWDIFDTQRYKGPAFDRMYVMPFKYLQVCLDLLDSLDPKRRGYYLNVNTAGSLSTLIVRRRNPAREPLLPIIFTCLDMDDYVTFPFPFEAGGEHVIDFVGQWKIVHSLINDYLPYDLYSPVLIDLQIPHWASKTYEIRF